MPSNHLLEAFRLVVVQDRPEALAVHDRHVGRSAQVQEEVLVCLPLPVGLDGDLSGLRGLAGCEGHRTGSSGVVRPGRGRTVGGGKIDRHGLAARRTQTDREYGKRRPTVAFEDRHVVDRQRRGRVVVQDRSKPLPIGDDGEGLT